jgi:hypothetical protein
LYKHESSKLWECGNRKAISKGGEKDGKPAFGFPGFPPPVISTALLLGVATIVKPALFDRHRGGGHNLYQLRPWTALLQSGMPVGSTATAAT